MTAGNIASPAATDTASANPTATYTQQPHGGPSKTYQSVCSAGGPIQSVDPLGQPTPVTGAPQLPLIPPVPQPLTRVPPIVGIVNSEARGVYFEGTLVPVVGDGIKAPGAAPDPRVLTTGGTYPTIFIGTTT